MFFARRLDDPNHVESIIELRRKIIRLARGADALFRVRPRLKESRPGASIAKIRKSVSCPPPAYNGPSELENESMDLAYDRIKTLQRRRWTWIAP